MIPFQLWKYGKGACFGERRADCRPDQGHADQGRLQGLFQSGGDRQESPAERDKIARLRKYHPPEGRNMQQELNELVLVIPAKSAGCSVSNRPPVPTENGRWFRSKSAT